MTDNITLPRDVAEKIFDAFGSEVYPSASSVDWHDIMDAFRTALAAPRLAVTVDPRLTPDEAAAILSALAAPQSEQTHPGYIIGSHWLETAYSRVCAGEAEADVLRDYKAAIDAAMQEDKT